MAKRFMSLLPLALVILWCAGCGERSVNEESASYDTSQWPASFEFGQRASAEKIALLDIDVRPDGKGLPAGEGTFSQGKVLFEKKCALCHGKTGTEGPYNKLVSVSQPEGKQDEKTIGNYWPYASTVFDYINRAMPYDHPGTLTSDEVYGITAFLLAKNNLIDSTIVLDASNLPQVIMPARELFINDDRKGGAEIR